MTIIRTIGLGLAVMVATFAVHEAAHGLMALGLGYDVFIRVNSAGPASGSYSSGLHRDLVDAAGPAMTLLQGLFGLWLGSRGTAMIGFATVLAAFLMRLLAAGISVINPNDEARLGLSWGIGQWTVHAAVVGCLLILTVLAVRRARPSTGPIITLVLAMQVGIAAVVLGERYLPTLYL
ncbi:hypothetical protein [Brevundimonas subvibrioides]|uniref:Peptidase M50 n=1 Tax=Brevundimonas subvibrioides (strain ATCC 15264 / DSM 4735 / LMG 14903 / NBRC 16000 / CB 81) TaxID=633149 RepID=D9QK62_BRESC|nr:hypothetical protein [Brevundimonas subvibrioides]ADL01647.1 hypothetical protein Bresu_2337 [Brevundimonas subvibrioides ATCC 15264]